jgi:hypothetical protein
MEHLEVLIFHGPSMLFGILFFRDERALVGQDKRNRCHLDSLLSGFHPENKHFGQDRGAIFFTTGL